MMRRGVGATQRTSAAPETGSAEDQPLGETGLTIGQVIAALPDDVRAALEEIKKRRGDRTLADALLATVYREQSLDHLRDQGWQLLVEKDGDVRELAEV